MLDFSILEGCCDYGCDILHIFRLDLSFQGICRQNGWYYHNIYRGCLFDVAIVRLRSAFINIWCLYLWYFHMWLVVIWRRSRFVGSWSCLALYDICGFRFGLWDRYRDLSISKRHLYPYDLVVRYRLWCLKELMRFFDWGLWFWGHSYNWYGLKDG